MRLLKRSFLPISIGGLQNCWHPYGAEKKFIGYLAHSLSLDDTFSTKIPAHFQNAKDVLRLLEEKGAHEDCFIFSENPEWDRKTWPLQDIIERVMGSRFATVISCRPGALAYFEGEDKGARYLLERPANNA